MSCVSKGRKILFCSPVQVDNLSKGLLFIFLEQNGTSSSFLLKDAVMAKSNEAYLKMQNNKFNLATNKK